MEVLDGYLKSDVKFVKFSNIEGCRVKPDKYNKPSFEIINGKGRQVYTKFILTNMQDQEKVLKYLVSVEKLAEEILSDKREIIVLDKRRNNNREALRDLMKTSQHKCWVTVGSVLIKHNLAATKTLLEADQNQLNIDINKLRSDLKVKVNNLRDLEMQEPVPGLMLVPLSQKETRGLSGAKLISP